MLPAAHRVTDAASFREATRRGRRASGRSMVTYLLVGDATGTEPARAGFVVSKAVGNAVHRNRTRRRLRHLVAARLASLPPGSALVVRALPLSASCSSAELARDLDACLRRSSERPREVRT